MLCHTTALECATAIIGRVASRTEPRSDSRLAARLAALASVGAAVIHVAVVPTHWHEWIPAGAFFLALATIQVSWAWAVLARATTPILAAGIAVNVAAIAVWAWSRTAGVPFGPHAGEAEIIQAADLCALLLQIYVVMGAGWVWYRGLRGEPVTAFASAATLLGAVCVVALASTVGVASGLRHDHHGPAGGEPDHHGSDIHQVDSDHGDHPRLPASAPVEKANGTPAVPPHVPGPSVPPSEDAHQHHDHDH